MPAKHYEQIGRHDRSAWLGELDFIWKSFQFYQNRGEDLATAPGSYVYHFRRGAPRPPSWKEIATRDMLLLKLEHGLTEKEIDNILDHYKILEHNILL